MKLKYLLFILIINIIPINPSLLSEQLNWIIPLQQEIHFTSFDSDLKAFQDIKSLKWGIINKEGEIIIPATYNRIFIINSNLFRVEYDFVYLIDRNQNIVFGKNKNYTNINTEPVFNSENNSSVFTFEKNGFYGIESLDGRISIGANYQSLIPLTSQLFIFFDKGKFGLLDMQGDTILLPMYNDIRKANENIITATKDGITNLFDFSGRPLLPNIYSRLDYQNPNHIFAERIEDVKAGNYVFGIIDIRNKLRLNFQYNHIRQIERDSQINYIVTLDKMYGILDEDLEPLIPTTYQSLRSYDDFLIFSTQNKFGIINYSNEKLLDADFDFLARVKDNFIGKQNDKYVFISSTLERLCDLEFDELDLKISDQLSRVKKDGKYGLVNEKGEIIGEIKYDEIHHFQYGYGKVLDKGKYGLVNEEGVEVIPCQFDDFYIGKNGLITVVDKFHVGLVKLPQL